MGVFRKLIKYFLIISLLWLWIIVKIKKEKRIQTMNQRCVYIYIYITDDKVFNLKLKRDCLLSVDIRVGIEFIFKRQMGNDAHFVDAEDLPLRLIDIPIGSAPPSIPKSHKHPIPSARVDGHDVPTASLVSPPCVPKRFDIPTLHIPQISDYNQQISTKNDIRKKIEHHRKILHKYKLTCCIIS